LEKPKESAESEVSFQHMAAKSANLKSAADRLKWHNVNKFLKNATLRLRASLLRLLARMTRWWR